MSGWRDEVRRPPARVALQRDAEIVLQRALASRRRTRMSMAVWVRWPPRCCASAGSAPSSTARRRAMRCTGCASRCSASSRSPATTRSRWPPRRRCNRSSNSSIRATGTPLRTSCRPSPRPCRPSRIPQRQQELQQQLNNLSAKVENARPECDGADRCPMLDRAERLVSRTRRDTFPLPPLPQLPPSGPGMPLPDISLPQMPPIPQLPLPGPGVPPDISLPELPQLPLPLPKPATECTAAHRVRAAAAAVSVAAAAAICGSGIPGADGGSCGSGVVVTRRVRRRGVRYDPRHQGTGGAWRRWRVSPRPSSRSTAFAVPAAAAGPQPLCASVETHLQLVSSIHFCLWMITEHVPSHPRPQQPSTQVQPAREQRRSP